MCSRPGRPCHGDNPLADAGGGCDQIHPKQRKLDPNAREKVRSRQKSAETPGEAALPYTKEEVEKLQKEILRLAAYWEPLMGVHCTGWQLREMKTRWGSCTVQTGKIRLNLSLARKPEACLEYVLVHELCHLLEPSHNARFPWPDGQIPAGLAGEKAAFESKMNKKSAFRIS